MQVLTLETRLPRRSSSWFSQLALPCSGRPWRWIWEHNQKKYDQYATNAGDEDGSAPNIQENKEGLELLKTVIAKVGYTGKWQPGRWSLEWMSLLLNIIVRSIRFMSPGFVASPIAALSTGYLVLRQVLNFNFPFKDEDSSSMQKNARPVSQQAAQAIPSACTNSLLNWWCPATQVKPSLTSSSSKIGLRSTSLVDALERKKWEDL